MCITILRILHNIRGEIMLEAIRVFVKSVECGSFSKAGVTLGMSPSSVSRQIDKLEKNLSAKLFKRSTRHLVLTDIGQSFFEKAVKIMADLDAAFVSIRPESNEAAGDLRISAYETFGRLRICPIIPEYLARHPKMRLELLLDNHVADLYKDEVDLAIRIGRPEDSRLKARKLVENKMVVCASSTYLEKYGMPENPHELSGHNCLVLSRSRRIVWWHFSHDKIAEKVQVKGNLSSIGGTPLLEAALQGVGITTLSNWVVAPYINSPDLIYGATTQLQSIVIPTP